MPTLSIRQKSLIFFLTISIIPLMAINLYWLRSEQSSLRNAAASRQTLLANSAADKVDEYLNDTINSLIIHSQTASVQQFDVNYASQELGAFIQQDADIQRIALVNSTGQEMAAFDRHGALSKLNNVADGDPFRVVTFLSGNEYISPVFYVQNVPHITIAAPIVTLQGSENISSLSTAESGVIRGPNDIHGALIADISLKNLWQSVLSTKLGTSGYAYLVDERGSLIAYPNQLFIKTHADQSQTAEVATFLKSSDNDTPKPQQTTSEKNVAVLSTYSRVNRTNWAVIAEEPLSSIYANVYHVSTIAIIAFWIAGTIAILLSLVFSHQLSTPIQKLTDGAKRLGSGDLRYRFSAQGGNEINTLAHTFNAMADNLSQVIKGVEAGRNKLDVVLNSISDGVVALDQDQRILVTNSAASALVGKLPREIIGQKLEDVFKWTKKNNSVSIDYAGTEYSQLELVGPTNSILYLDVIVAQIIEDPTGIKAIITIHNETKSRELEAMKVDFVSMAAHELRTPLTAIRGYLSLIGDSDPKMDAKQRQYLERVRASSNQLAGLVNNLLNVTRIEKGTLSMNFDKLDWVTIAKNVVKDQSFSAHQKDITIAYHGPEESLPILGDEVAMTEVLNNLVANAIHYSPRGAHIDVSIWKREHDILTAVSDNGIGIPLKAQAKLFTKFYRVHGGLAMGSGGTGLGLYISKSIVELHNGRIWVHSEPGKGSTFYFNLPYFDQERYDKLSNHQTTVRKKSGWVTKNITR